MKSLMITENLSAIRSLVKSAFSLEFKFVNGVILNDRAG